MLQGFDAAAWLVIALQIAGGLLVGMVVKYCDNILKVRMKSLLHLHFMTNLTNLSL